MAVIKENEHIKDLQIVVVDDSAPFATYIRGVASRAGAKVTVFSSGSEALTYLSASQPDLIITDLEMPEMSGLEFIASIRGESSFSDVPILMLTGREDEATMCEAIAVGADAFAAKSTIRATLLAHITALARLRQTYKSASRGKQLDAVQALIGTYKHEFGNALAIVDGKLKKLMRANPELESDDSLKSVFGGIERFKTTLRRLDELRSYDETDYAGATKILKTGS